MAAKQEGSSGFVGSCAPSWNGSLAGEVLRSNSIREDETALCLDCKVTFNVRNRGCPKCGSDHFWLTAKWRRTEPARESARVLRLPPPRAWRPALVRNAG
ncbi:MAG TPA: hypothetical protein VH854_08835 [Thermoanaerobaculia bacterium]|jgi:hypothetical protein|nr:hypothetical protein [Thermoanaerobaculia bacterium]